MNKRHDIDASYSLEHRLSQSIDNIRDNLTRFHALRQQIRKIRAQRRQLQQVPEDVRQWFEDTAKYLDEEEEEEGEE